MAEVMNELSTSNGEVDDDNDEVTLNGDACDDVSSIAENSLSQILDDQSLPSKEKRSGKKLTASGDNDIDETDDSNVLREQISEKNRTPSNVANGRLKPDGLSSEAEGENSRNNVPVDKSSTPANNYTEKTNQNDCDSSNERLSDEEEVEDEEDEEADDFSNCDSNKSDRKQSRGNNEDKEQVSSDDCRILTKEVDSRVNRKSSGGGISHDENGSNDNEVATDLSKRDDSSSDAVIVSEKKANGDDEDDAIDDDEVISISSTPDKSKKISKKPSLSIVNITPRRSSRNLNKQKSYAEKDNDFEGSSGSEITATVISGGRKRGAGSGTGEDDEIEEITPTDPLADEPRSSKTRNKTIVVSDTKGLVEFASNTKACRSNKKEPTLVIIDTNSILSGRGPIPVSQQSGSSGSLMHSSSSAPIPVSLPIAAGAFANATRGSTSSSSAFSVIPIGLPAQGMYSQFKNPPPQIKPIVVGPASTTVTPVPLVSSTASVSVSATTITTVSSTQSTSKQPPIVLPSLTDDMFVVEAPSFIVPYVYEKPPMKSLKEHIDKIETDIKQEEAKREKREREPKDSHSDKTTQSDSDDKDATDKEDDAEKDDEDGEPKKTSSEGKDSTAAAASTAESPSKEKNDTQPMEVDDDDVASKSTTTISVTTTETTESTSSVVKKMEIDSPANAVKEIEKKITAGPTTGTDDPKKPASYFDNPLGKFFMQIGLNLVQEHVQTDLLRSQKRKRDKEGGKCSQDVQSAIEELTKTLESSKENNDPFKLELKKCELCSFKTESLLVMAHHLETPHMKNYTYRCNFCPLEVRSPHDILYHMEAEHNIRGRLERAPAFHQCPNCPFEDNQKGKLTRHLISCSKKYRPERNQEPPLDWEPPAKIPRVTRNRPPSMSPGNAVYQAAMSGLKQVPQNTLLPKLMPNTTNLKHNMLNANKRPNLGPTFVNRFPNANAQPNFQQRPINMQNATQGMMYRAAGTNSQTPVLLPQGYHLSGAQIYQTANNKSQSSQQGLAAAKLLNQPSISITPLPRQTPSNSTSSNSKSGGKPTNAAGNKGNFVVCEICDGYIKDLEQLRNHMQWIHKVKIHPKMIYNRPPLNCQKCQERFFTDQGLERHLLGAHGLVTSSMQEAANKGKDGGRCPVCGRVYQWKLLNHVARDHQMALKPAHLSYKCTVCTATFGMYKQFESHVYSAHSVVAKRAMDTSKKPPSSASSSQNDTLLKPLKINDEITIIPQPVRTTKPVNKSSNAATITTTVTSAKSKMDNEDNDKDDDDNTCKRVCSLEYFADDEEFRRHVYDKHVKQFNVKISRLNLKMFDRVPNKENAFKLTKGPTVEQRIRDEYKLRDFFIPLKRHRLDVECKYKIVENGKTNANVRGKGGGQVDLKHLVPSVVYSGAEDDRDSAGKNKRRGLQVNTVYEKRLIEKHLLGDASTTAPNAANGRQKRLMSRGRRNATRRNRRNRRSNRSSDDDTTSSSDVDVIDEQSAPSVSRNARPIADHDHFMSGLSSFAPFTSGRQTTTSVQHVSRVTASRTGNVGAVFNIATNRNSQPVRFITVPSRVTTSKTTRTVNNSAAAPFGVINRQTVTTSTSSTTFGHVGNKPAGQASNADTMQFCRQRSVKVTRCVTTFSNASTAPVPPPRSNPVPQNQSISKQDVVSLLSDSSESDDSAVEIIEPVPVPSDDNEVYILPT